MASLLFLGTLVLCTVSLVLTHNTSTAITVLIAATYVSVPITDIPCVNIPVDRLSALACRCGTMLAGNPAVEYFYSTNTLVTDTKELFPRETVILDGIGTLGGQRINETIMGASAVMRILGSSLSDLFEQITQNRRNILPKAENITYENECGVTGQVSGRRTLVGARQLLEQHGLTLPSRDYENEYPLGGKRVVYLASQGELAAMFVISYNPDKRHALEPCHAEQNDISPVLHTMDPSTTPEFAAECFSLDPHSVQILPEALGAIYQSKIIKELEYADILSVSKGRPASTM